MISFVTKSCTGSLPPACLLNICGDRLPHPPHRHHFQRQAPLWYSGIYVLCVFIDTKKQSNQNPQNGTSYIEYKIFKFKNDIQPKLFVTGWIFERRCDSWALLVWDGLLGSLQVGHHPGFCYVVKSLLTLVYNVSLCHLSSVSSLAAEDTGMHRATLTGSTQVWGEPGSRTQSFWTTL